MPIDNSREVFVKNLREQMARHNVTQKELANVLGTSTSTVSDWVNGKKYPRIDVMQKLADYFGLLMSELTTDDAVNQLDNLTEDEQELIRLYRSLNNKNKIRAAAYLEGISDTQ